MSTKIKLWTLESEDAAPELLGPLDYKEGDTYAVLRTTLEEADVVDWPFSFWDTQTRCRIKERLEKLNRVGLEVFLLPLSTDVSGGRKRKPVPSVDREGEFDHQNVEFPPSDNDDDFGPCEVERVPAASGAGSSMPCISEKPVDVQEDHMTATLLSTEELQRYMGCVDKLKVDLKRITLDDHEWYLKSWDKDGKAIVKLYCGECSKLYGNSTGDHSKTAVYNLFGNFGKKHLQSIAYVKNFCIRKGIDFQAHPQSQSKDKPAILTREDHQQLVEEGLGIVDIVNNSVTSSSKKPFVPIGDKNSPDMRCFWFRVKCAYCGDFFSLCPPQKNLEANLLNHLMGTKHDKAVEDQDGSRGRAKALRTGKKGRPATSGSRSETQASLHSWWSSKAFASSATGQVFDCLTLLCWGYWREHCEYGGKNYLVKDLLNDMHVGGNWIVEPKTKGTIQSKTGDVVHVHGCFRHVSCKKISLTGEPFTDLTCSKCVRIPQEVDFRLRVIREEASLDKRGTRSTGQGRRFGYLQYLELVGTSCKRCLEVRILRTQVWANKAKVARLKVRRPTLKEATRETAMDGDVLKFCQNIIAAHRGGAFGGRPALWDYLRDAVSNLNRKKQGFRYSTNTRCFAQAVKLYGGRRLTDLFALNLLGPSLSTVKRASKKGMQFQAGFHLEIFEAIGEIYQQAIIAHNLEGPIPIILAEDETKVKSRISWDSRNDRLSGFCGLATEHTCCPGFYVVVGNNEAGYGNIVDSFRDCRIGSFARVIMVNPLHSKLPRLIIACCTTCNCFTASWIRHQWREMDRLWKISCLQSIGPIIGHSSDGDSRRRQLMLEDYRGTTGERRSIPWAGWNLTATKNELGQVVGLGDQDFIHNGKKLINPLDSPVRVLQLGADICCLEHLGLVYNKFSVDEHGLKLEDINRSDRQN